MRTRNDRGAGARLRDSLRCSGISMVFLNCKLVYSIVSCWEYVLRLMNETVTLLFKELFNQKPLTMVNKTWTLEDFSWIITAIVFSHMWLKVPFWASTKSEWKSEVETWSTADEWSSEINGSIEPHLWESLFPNIFMFGKLSSLREEYKYQVFCYHGCMPMGSSWTSGDALSTLQVKVGDSIQFDIQISLKTQHGVLLTWMSICGGVQLMVGQSIKGCMSVRMW